MFYFTRKYACKLFVMYVSVYHTDSKMPEISIRTVHYGKKKLKFFHQPGLLLKHTIFPLDFKLTLSTPSKWISHFPSHQALRRSFS